MDEPFYNWKMLEQSIDHLKEMMTQHDKLTELAITKYEAAVDERFLKVNEFREQQKDIIQTFARDKETKEAIASLTNRLEQNIKSVTERYEANLNATKDKIEALERSLTQRIELVKQNLEEKRDAGISHLESNINSVINAQGDKFIAADKQTLTLINSNAEVSNNGLKILGKSITDINSWKDFQTGRQEVIAKNVGILIAAVISIAIAVIASMIIYFLK